MNPAATATLASIGLLATGAARGDELRPMQGETVQLGPVSGSIVYTALASGFRVVTTLVETPQSKPVRFVATLAPGEEVVVSVPREAGEPPYEVRLRRVGDRLVTDGPAMTGPPID